MRNPVAISLVVPVYNTEKYLNKCLDSILHQTLQEIEIIVVNDGSTDGSRCIIENFRQKDNRIKAFHIINGGVSAARNYGIERSCGKYVMFVDSDDWIAPDMCATLYDKAEEFNVDFVICGNYNVSTVAITPRKIFPNEKIFVGQEYKREIVVSTLGLVGDKIRNMERLDRLTPIWARLYKNSIIKNYNIRFIDLNKLPSECLQFNFEFALKAQKALYVDQAFYYYRRNTLMSVTKPFRDNLLGKWIWWIDYMDEFILVNCNTEFYWKAFYSRICTSVIPLGGNALKLSTIRDRLRECKKILDDKRLSEAFAKTDFSSCKLYWRVFFYVASKHHVFFLVAYLVYENDFEIKKIVNMKYQPLVSIVIPVYKGDPYLRNAIQSCLDQTYKNIEIIVVNDGSPDGGRTKAIAQSFGDKIRYFEKANGGVSTALNYGISQMKGEWFSWLSHDDLYLPDKIEKQLDAIDKETDKVCVVRCTTMSVNENEEPLFRPQRKIKGVFTAAQMMRLHSLKEVGLYGCALLIHRKILDACGSFDDTLRTVQDEDYWNRIMFKGYRFISVPDILVKIRIHTLQTTNLLSDKFAEERVVLTDRVIDYYNEDRKRNYSLLLTFCRKQYKERRKYLGEKMYTELKKNDDFALRDEVLIRACSCYGIFYAVMKKVYRQLFIKPNR